jgi:hypothetical protein
MHILVGSFYKRHAVTAQGGSDRPEAHGFRICFTPLGGVLFTFPSRYWCTIGRLRYLALGRGRPRFPPDFSCPVVLTFMTHAIPCRCAYGTLTPCGRPFQQRSAPGTASRETPAAVSGHHVQPRPGIGSSLSRQHGLGSSRFARRYYGNPLSSSGYVRCFSSPGSPRIAAVLPFGRGLPHSDIVGSSVASTSPTHFVAWPRPSSASDA